MENTIYLAENYALKLDSDDYERLKTVDLQFNINDDYTKTIKSAEGISIRDLLGLPSGDFIFIDQDDLNYRNENLRFSKDLSKF